MSLSGAFLLRMEVILAPSRTQEEVSREAPAARAQSRENSTSSENVGCLRLLLLGPPALCLLLVYPAAPTALQSVIDWREGLMILKLAFFGAILGHIAAPGYYAVVVKGVPSKHGLLRSWMAASVLLGAFSAFLSFPAFAFLAYPLLILPSLTVVCSLLLYREFFRAPPSGASRRKPRPSEATR